MDIIERLNKSASDLSLCSFRPAEIYAPIMLEAAKEIKSLREEFVAAEKLAQEGYAQAYAIIQDLRNKLDIQKEEFEEKLLAGYEEAFQELKEMRNKLIAQAGSLSHEIVGLMLDKSEIEEVYDFNQALGDTIMEKYEWLYVTLINTAKKIRAFEDQPLAGKIVANREVCSIFETATAGFAPTMHWTDDEGVPQLGVINRRWAIYFDRELPKDILLLSNESPDTPPRFATIRIVNFVI